MQELLAPTVDDLLSVVDAPYRYATSTVVVEESTVWGWHRHVDAELLWAVRGRVEVWTPTLAWTAVPGPALTIGPGVRHRVRVTGPASLFCTYARGGPHGRGGSARRSGRRPLAGRLGRVPGHQRPHAGPGVQHRGRRTLRLVAH